MSWDYEYCQHCSTPFTLTGTLREEHCDTYTDTIKCRGCCCDRDGACNECSDLFDAADKIAARSPMPLDLQAIARSAHALAWLEAQAPHTKIPTPPQSSTPAASGAHPTMKTVGVEDSPPQASTPTPHRGAA